MRKLCITFLILSIILVSGIAISLPDTQTNKEYLRIHIRANSNDQIDQDIKYRVKDRVVQYLTPYIAECDTKLKAERLLSDRLEEIEAVADNVLRQAGFSYTAKAKVNLEEFPTRVYGTLELKSGVYQALIIELGSGDGDNWWCVVYPPLCFTGEGTGVVYRSKILSIISDFFKKEKT